MALDVTAFLRSYCDQKISENQLDSQQLEHWTKQRDLVDTARENIVEELAQEVFEIAGVR